MADVNSDPNQQQGALSYLFGQQAPSSITSNVAATNGLPDWYQQYLSGIAGKATQIAGNQSNMEIPAASVAGFNQDQIDSFNKVRGNQGVWQPGLTAGAQAAGTIMPNATNMVNAGSQAVSGPAQSWDTAAAKKYMSPYTEQVVQEIQRLGMRNLQENLLPAVQDQFIGAGQFGSTRNADILGRTVRDANTDMNGQMINALNGAYTNAQTAFTGDANRAQQQQQMQGSYALNGAGALTQAAQGAASSLGANAQAQQAAGLTDAQQLSAVGKQQQDLQQAGLDTAVNNANTANNFDWNTLNNMSSIIRGQQLPTTAVQTSNAPLQGAGYTAGPLTQVAAVPATIRP